LSRVVAIDWLARARFEFMELSAGRMRAKMNAKNGLRVGLFFAGILFLAACNKNPASGNAFQSAPAEKKAVWDAATSAMSSNNYLGAITNLDSLLAQTDLSDEQKKAVTAAESSIRDRMYTAANKGDAAAQQALDELRNARMR